MSQPTRPDWPLTDDGNLSSSTILTPSGPIADNASVHENVLAHDAPVEPAHAEDAAPDTDKGSFYWSAKSFFSIRSLVTRSTGKASQPGATWRQALIINVNSGFGASSPLYKGVVEGREKGGYLPEITGVGRTGKAPAKIPKSMLRALGVISPHGPFPKTDAATEVVREHLSKLADRNPLKTGANAGAYIQYLLHLHDAVTNVEQIWEKEKEQTKEDDREIGLRALSLNELYAEVSTALVSQGLRQDETIRANWQSVNGATEYDRTWGDVQITDTSQQMSTLKALLCAIKEEKNVAKLEKPKMEGRHLINAYMQSRESRGVLPPENGRPAGEWTQIMKLHGYTQNGEDWAVEELSRALKEAMLFDQKYEKWAFNTERLPKTMHPMLAPAKP